MIHLIFTLAAVLSNAQGVPPPVNFLACSAWVASPQLQIMVRVSNLDSLGQAPFYGAESMGIFWDDIDSIFLRRYVTHLGPPEISVNHIIVPVSSQPAVQDFGPLRLYWGSYYGICVFLKDSLGQWSGWGDRALYVLEVPERVPVSPVNHLDVDATPVSENAVRVAWQGYIRNSFVEWMGLWWQTGTFHTDSTIPADKMYRYGSRYFPVGRMNLPPDTIRGLLPNTQYFFSVNNLDSIGWGPFDGGFSSGDTATTWPGQPGSATKNSGTLPTIFALGQNQPNPFNPTTVISYAIPVRARRNAPVLSTFVHLCIYDTRGHLVRALVHASQAPGYYSAAWDGRADDGREMASGVYVYQLTAGGKTMMKKALLMK